MGDPAAKDKDADVTVSRREALAALARYSAVLGGAAATVVSADSLVAVASAYPAVCERNPSSPACSGGTPPGQSGGNNNGNNNGNNAKTSERVVF